MTLALIEQLRERSIAVRSNSIDMTPETYLQLSREHAQ